MQTRKEAKRAEAEAYLALVRSTLQEAHGAATAAFADFMRSTPLTPEGHVMELCGSADVIAYKLSYRLRTALKALNEIERADGGAWCVSNFTRSVNQQAITARRVACDAAKAILVRAFPGEGEFYTRSRVD